MSADDLAPDSWPEIQKLLTNFNFTIVEGYGYTPLSFKSMLVIAYKKDHKKGFNKDQLGMLYHRKHTQ